MGSFMRAEMAPAWQFGAMGVIFVASLLLAIIIGAVGPHAETKTAFTAYQCKDGSHNFNSSHCSGHDLALTGAPWRLHLGPAYTTNRFWALTLTPYLRKQHPTAVEYVKVEVEVNVSYRESPNEVWKTQSHGERHIFDFKCGRHERQACNEKRLLYEETVDHKFYEVTVRLLNHTAHPVAEKIGDMGFMLLTGNASYTNMEIFVNIIYLLATLGCITSMLWRMRNDYFPEWTFEQKFMFLLAFAVLFYNNPFFSLRYLVKGIFFTLLDSIFHVHFVSLLLLFFLLHFDKLRREDTGLPEDSRIIIAKGGVVGAFFLFCVIFLGWSSARDKVDPVFGQDPSAGVNFFFALAIITFVAIAAWIVGTIALILKDISNRNRNFVLRFFYALVPAKVIVICFFIALCLRDIGPLRQHSAVDLTFFSTLFNVYVWSLMAAYWPVQRQSFSGRNPVIDDGDVSSSHNGEIEDEDEAAKRPLQAGP